MATGKKTIPQGRNLPPGWLKNPTQLAPTSVEEARQDMLDAKETFVSKSGRQITPSFKDVEGGYEAQRKASDAAAAAEALARHEAEVTPSRGQGGNTPVKQEEPIVSHVAVPVAERKPADLREGPVVVTRQYVPIDPEEVGEQRERVETADFVGEIYRDGNEWVAELIYKNGAGNERFTAPNLKQLTKKMLEGKGHATMKVRAEVRRRKLGTQLDTFENTLIPAIQQLHNLTPEQFYALPQSVQTSIVASIQVPEVNAFMQEYPEFYNVQSNWDEINRWLLKENAPATRRNVGMAFTDLAEDGILAMKPSVQPVPQPPISIGAAAEVPVTAAVPVVVDSTPAATAAPRKRGQSGIIPGQSSAAPVTVPAAVPEEGNEPRQLSRKELLQLDPKEHRRLAIPSLSRPSGIQR